MSRLPTLVVGALALTLGFSSPAAGQDDRAPAPGRLAAPAGVAGYQGAPDDFGKRVDGSGELMIVADDNLAVVYNTTALAFESTDLVATSASPPATATDILDVAIDGDLAMVLVERSSGAQMPILMAFRRVVVLGNPVWVASGQADVGADLFVPDPTPCPSGLVEVRGEDAVVAVTSDVGGEFAHLLLYDASVAGAISHAADEVASPGRVTSLAVSDTLLFLGAPDEFGVVVCVDHPTFGRTVLPHAASVDLVFLLVFAVVDDPLAPGSRYGESVAIDGFRCYVGEPGADLGGTDTGRVLFYDLQVSSSPQQVLTPDAPVDGDEFGRALALNPSGTKLAVSELQADAIPAASDTGYIRTADVDPGSGLLTLTHDTYGFAATLSGSDENMGVDLSFAADGTLHAGAPGNGIAGYIAWFFFPSSNWIEVDQSPALAGTGGIEPTQVLEGAIYADGPVVIGVRDALPLSTTYMIIGLSTINAPAKGGIVYPALNLVKAFPTNAAGERIIPTLWLESSVLLGPFDTYFQWWVADPGGPVGFSATAGGVIHQY